MLVFIILGIIVGLFVGQKDSAIDNFFGFLSQLSINLLLYLTGAYVLVKTFLGLLEIKKSKFSAGKLFIIFLVSIIISVLFSIIVSFGFMNLNFFQPDFNIVQGKAEPIKTYSFYEIFLNIINTNAFSSLTSTLVFVLPVIFIGIIFANAAYHANKKGLYFIEVVESFDSVLSIIIHQIIEIFPFLSIFVISYLFCQGIFTEANWILISKPFFACLVILVIVLFFYTIFIYVVLKKNILQFYHGILGAVLIGFVSGNSASAIIPLNEHLKRNIGIKKVLSDTLTPVGMALNKSGSVIISVVVLMTLILCSSPSILDLSLQVELFFLIFIFSFSIDGINQAGFLAVVASVMSLQMLHLEPNSYLLFISFIPLLGRFGVLLDVISTAIFVTITAKFTDNIEKREYIDYI
jgi:Na+/H+-dicarboxylate symporter